MPSEPAAPVEPAPPVETSGAVGPVSGSRDPDLSALERFESEFAELESELDRVDRSGRADTDASTP